jgi:hypothetical protein
MDRITRIIDQTLCFLLLDERLHKGIEGTGPRQRGGAAECPQVSWLWDRLTGQAPLQIFAKVGAAGGQGPE